jgi:hypothetical protein
MSNPLTIPPRQRVGRPEFVSQISSASSAKLAERVKLELPNLLNHRRKLWGWLRFLSDPFQIHLGPKIGEYRTPKKAKTVTYCYPVICNADSLPVFLQRPKEVASENVRIPVALDTALNY